MSIKQSETKNVSNPPHSVPQEVYENDFEVYDDDFEEEENSSIEDAPTIHNSNILNRISNKKSIDDRHQPFNEASIYNHLEEERKAIQRRCYERTQMLRGLITIQTSKCTVINDLASNILENQLGPCYHDILSQTGSECKNEKLQTDGPLQDSKYVQCPQLETTEDYILNERICANRDRFRRFFFAATKVVSDILIRDDKKTEEEECQEKSCNKFSKGFNTFDLGLVAPTTCVVTCDPNSILVAFEIHNSPAQDLINRSLIVEFYIHSRRPPKRLFLVQSSVVEMKVGQLTNSLIVSCKDGTICAFDLSLTDGYFENFFPWVDSDSDIALRHPTFDSSYLATTISEASPIIGLHIRKSTNSEEITTVDTTGTIHFWNASRYHNELKITLTAVVRPHPSLQRHGTSIHVNCFCSLEKPSRFILGTDTSILYSVQHVDVSQCSPKIYETDRQRFGEVTAIVASPHQENSLILVGFSTGFLCIYLPSQASPIISLSSIKRRITNLQWSLVTPGAFYSIHDDSTIGYWDISYGNTPRFSEKIEGNSKINYCCSWDSKHSKGSAGIVYLAFTRDNGSCDVHILETFSKNDGEAMSTMIRKLKEF